MNNEIQGIIKSLVQQCNIESISTKDLATELTELYTEVGKLERELTYKHEEIKELKASYERLNRLCEEYKRTHVTPAEKLEADQAALDKERFKFDVEKEYMKREVAIFREIVKSLTVSYGLQENYYGGQNQASWNKQANIDKPFLPNDSSVKFPGEK